MIKAIFKTIFGLAFILILVAVALLFLKLSPQASQIVWGVNFSQKQSENLGLNWKENYTSLLDDLKVKNLKLASHWDLLERAKDEYQFDDLDWQVDEADKRGAKVILVIGMKTSRWPECHLPEWAKSLSKVEQQKEILDMLRIVVSRYRDSENIKYWQVENEPLFEFGECPWSDKDFLKQEINLVKSLDDKPVIISDSGEWSMWLDAAKLGDLVGITTYRKVWFTPLNIYVSYPLTPAFYGNRAEIIKKLFDKEVIGVELQAEPWCESFLKECPLEEQEKTMSLEKLKENIEFAKNTGLKEFYLWGAEWWYWMKISQNNSAFWEEVKNLF